MKIQSKFAIVMACVLGISTVFSGCGSSRVAEGATDHKSPGVGDYRAPRGRRASQEVSPTKRGWLDPRARRASQPTSYRELWHEQFKYACDVQLKIRHAQDSGSFDVAFAAIEQDITRRAMLESSVAMTGFYQKFAGALAHAKTLPDFGARKENLIQYCQHVMDNCDGASELRSKAFLKQFQGGLNIPATTPS